MINTALTRKKRVYFSNEFKNSVYPNKVKFENIDFLSPWQHGVELVKDQKYWDERFRVLKTADIYVVASVPVFGAVSAVEVGVCLASGIKVYVLGGPVKDWIVSDCFVYFDRLEVLLDWINCEHTEIIDVGGWEYSALACKKCGWGMGSS